MLPSCMGVALRGRTSLAAGIGAVRPADCCGRSTLPMPDTGEILSVILTGLSFLRREVMDQSSQKRYIITSFNYREVLLHSAANSAPIQDFLDSSKSTSYIDAKLFVPSPA